MSRDQEKEPHVEKRDPEIPIIVILRQEEEVDVEVDVEAVRAHTIKMFIWTPHLMLCKTILAQDSVFYSLDTRLWQDSQEP